MFGDTLKSLRKSKGLTQTEFARIMNVAIGTVGNWEVNTRTPDYNLLIQIANYFNVSIDYLLGREDSFGAPYPYDTQNRPEQKKPIAIQQQASDLADNFIKEFGEYFSEQNFIKLAKLYKVMSAEQALIAIGWIAGMLEQSGVKVKNIL